MGLRGLMQQMGHMSRIGPICLISPIPAVWHFGCRDVNNFEAAARCHRDKLDCKETDCDS
jgi:hypothetical protein